MKMKSKLLFLSLLLLNGCAQPLPTEVDVSEMNTFIEFNVNDDISIKNVQNNNDRIVMAEIGIAVFSGSKKEWTDTAVEITSKELIDRRAVISPEANKSLSLSISSVKCEQPGLSIVCKVQMEVIAGNGYSAIYTGNAESALTLFRAANYSLANVVSAMFRDPKVIDYISG